MDYNFHEIEKKWQKYWEDNKTFKTPEDLNKSEKMLYSRYVPLPFRSRTACWSS